ncbi:unnamed protein product [Protopolystoma xenopodis]|uniref:Uncharacterized protein n=1 Tax=Protopolystoma xenopodis TaxID=117903 RepID=A0A448XKI1_9PLAT|nr:unnamed protein product [Protopolystoma xenopodis]
MFLDSCSDFYSSFVNIFLLTGAASLFDELSLKRVLRMARFTNDADYDAGGTSGYVPHPRSDTGDNQAYYGLWTRCAPIGLPANMTNLRILGHTTTTIEVESSFDLAPQRDLNYDDAMYHPLSP